MATNPRPAGDSAFTSFCSINIRKITRMSPGRNATTVGVKSTEVLTSYRAYNKPLLLQSLVSKKGPVGGLSRWLMSL